MIGILKKIRSLFKPEKIEIRGVTRIYTLKQLERKIKRENARLMAENLRLKEEIERLKEEIKRLKGEIEEEVKEEIELQKKMLAKLRKEGIYDILFNLPKPVQVVSFIGKQFFRGSDGRTFKYLRGIRLIHSYDHGTYFQILVSKKPKGKELGVIKAHIPFGYFPFVFEDYSNIGQNLKMGVLTLNITPDGKFIPPQIESSNSKKKKKKSNNPFKKFNKTLKRVDPEAREIIIDLLDRIENLRAELTELRKALRKAELENIELKASQKVLLEDFDRYTTSLSVALHKLSTAYDNMLKLKLKEVDASVAKSIATMVTKSLFASIDNVIKRIPKIGREEREIIREELEREFKFIADRINEIIAPKLLIEEKKTEEEERRRRRR